MLKHTFSMNRLPLERRAQILLMIAEGNSLRAVSRMADVSFNTVIKLLLDVADACERYQDETLRGLKCRRIQCDEIWAFVYAKAKNVPEEHAGEFGYGDVWTWTALEAETKLLITWAVGRRDGFTAQAFIRDLADRLSTRLRRRPSWARSSRHRRSPLSPLSPVTEGRERCRTSSDSLHRQPVWPGPENFRPPLLSPGTR